MIKGRKTARSTILSLHWEEKQKKKELPFLGYFSLVAARRIAAPAISEPGEGGLRSGNLSISAAERAAKIGFL